MSKQTFTRSCEQVCGGAPFKFANIMKEFVSAHPSVVNWLPLTDQSYSLERFEQQIVGPKLRTLYVSNSTCYLRSEDAEFMFHINGHSAKFQVRVYDGIPHYIIAYAISTSPQ